MTQNPYEGLPDSAFWRLGVAQPGPHQISGLWTPKFQIKKTDKVVTAGSCFAQHIGRALSENGYAWTDFEPAPPFLPDEKAREFGYGIFSFRTGNIYTPSMLWQWLRLAYGASEAEPEFWHKDGRVYDALRPAIEPQGFATEDEARAGRAETYRALRAAVEGADVFVFTLGLTEHWVNRYSKLEYAMCPGTLAGEFDPKRHRFRNANIQTSAFAMRKALEFLKKRNPDLRVLLTVSPVPLTATASGQHVLTATTYSKSVLRGVAGMMAAKMGWVDYFPSYEIITNPVFRGMFFAPNMRSVDPVGVKTVMECFFADQARVFGPRKGDKPRNAVVQHSSAHAPAPEADLADDDVACEEVMLDAFAR